MTVKNGTLTDDDEEIEVKVESDTEGGEESNAQGTGEETPLTNETSKPKSQDGKRSAGKVIADLGNEKKALAAKLVSLAKTSENSRQEVKRMLIEDPATANYLKVKFGDEYDLITSDEPITGEKEVNIEKIKEQAKAQAEAEAIKLQIQRNHEELVSRKAEQLGFTSEELETFKGKVELLGGDEKAIEDAALIVNFKKATAKKGEYTPDEGEAEQPRKRQVTITPGLSDLADSQRLDKKEFAKDIHRVKSLHRKDEYGKDVMDLPSL